MLWLFRLGLESRSQDSVPTVFLVEQHQLLGRQESEAWVAMHLVEGRGDHVSAGYEATLFSWDGDIS